MIPRINHAPRKFEPCRITAARPPLHFRPTGITKPEHLRHLIERLPRRVVHGPAKDPVIAECPHFHQQRVPAAHDQRHVRRDGKIPGEKRRQQVPFEMIDREIRFPKSERETFGSGRSDHQRRRETRPRRRGERIDLRERDARFLHGRRKQPRHVHEVIARSDFRDHAAVLAMLRLRSDFARQ